MSNLIRTSKDRKTFVHCPKPGCDKPLKGSWSDYLTGTKHPKTGMPVYQCPICGFKFTADAFRANAVPVTGDDRDVVLYDESTRKVLDIISHRMKFTDGKFHYIHLPLALCIRKNLRCFSFEAKGLTYGEIAELCESAIRNKVEVLR